MLTTPQAWLLHTAHDALDLVNARTTGMRPANWGPQHEQGVGSALLAAITAVEQDERRSAQLLREVTMPDPIVDAAPTTDVRDVTRALMEAVTAAYHAAYREEPYTHAERAQLLGTIEHAIVRLSPLQHHLLYQYRKEGL